MCRAQQVGLVTRQKLAGSPVKRRPRMWTDIDVAENIVASADHEHFESLTSAAKAKALTANISDIVEAAEDVSWWGRAAGAISTQGSIPPISQINLQ